MQFEPMEAAEFKRLREKVGDQAKVAAMMESHNVTLSKWETGKRAVPGPARVLIRKLAEEAELMMQIDQSLDARKQAREASDDR